MTVIDERIRVIAIFENSRCGETMRPVKFRWRGRLYPIEEITYRWKSLRGQSTILHFSVSDGTTLYELTCNKHSLKWWLSNIEG